MDISKMKFEIQETLMWIVVIEQKGKQAEVYPFTCRRLATEYCKERLVKDYEKLNVGSREIERHVCEMEINFSNGGDSHADPKKYDKPRTVYSVKCKVLNPTIGDAD